MEAAIEIEPMNKGFADREKGIILDDSKETARTGVIHINYYHRTPAI
jgi:hypothetical protein